MNAEWCVMNECVLVYVGECEKYCACVWQEMRYEE